MTQGLPSWTPNWSDITDIQLAVQELVIVGSSEASGLRFSRGSISPGGNVHGLSVSSFHGGHLTVQSILIGPIHAYIRGDNPNTIHEADSEFRSRIKFLLSGFVHEEEWNDDTACIIALMFKLAVLRKAIALTLPSIDQDFWSDKEFTAFCLQFARGSSSLKDCTSSHRDLVQKGLLEKRSLFRCCLPEQSLPLAERTLLGSDVGPLAGKTGETPQTILMNGGMQMAARQLLGLSRAEVEVGDIIAVVIGCNAPIILRPVEDTGHFRVIGAAYVERLMEGQALGKLPEVDITLC